MPGKVTLKIVGDWRKEIATPLRNAMYVSMDICGKTGEGACQQALWYMAQSAGKLVSGRRKTRRIKRDEHGDYVEIYKRGQSAPSKFYRWQAKRISDSAFRNARTIGNRGLGRRSWMWGLRHFGRGEISKEIVGGSQVSVIKGEAVSGFMKENRLDYMLKALPGGWEMKVARSATNRIMAHARNRLEAKWRRDMGMPLWAKGMPKQSTGQLSKYFLRGAAA